jgi:RNA polymerase sigma-70 factor (ECF subfamily)
MDTTDEVIVDQVRKGDTDAFGELVVRYEGKLKRYARKFLSREGDIEDLVQDVFIKAYTNIQSFDTSQRFSPWIYRIAHNTFVNELKRKDRSRLSLFDFDELLPTLAAPETADADTLNEELKCEMDTLLSALEPKYREILILHYFEDLSYREISDVLHIPITTAGVRLTRARKKLQDMYNQQNHERT